MNTKKKMIAVVVCVSFGFFGAFFLFRFLTGRQQIDTSVVVASSREEKIIPPAPASALPTKLPESKLEAGRDQLDKSLRAPTVATIKKQAVVDEESKEVVFPPLRVNGIFSSKEGNIALINDVIMREGDVILGVKVVRIHANSVEMEMKGQTKTLRIK